jgi:hypothetical protein
MASANSIDLSYEPGHKLWIVVRGVRRYESIGLQEEKGDWRKYSI